MKWHKTANFVKIRQPTWPQEHTHRQRQTSITWGRWVLQHNAQATQTSTEEDPPKKNPFFSPLWAMCQHAIKIGSCSTKKKYTKLLPMRCHGKFWVHCTLLTRYKNRKRKSSFHSGVYGTKWYVVRIFTEVEENDIETRVNPLSPPHLYIWLAARERISSPSHYIYFYFLWWHNQNCIRDEWGVFEDGCMSRSSSNHILSCREGTEKI